MTRSLRAILVVLALCGVALPARADLVSPARLDIIETEPGRLDVTFTLPIVNGRKPNFEPLFPPGWTRVTEPEVVANANSHTTRVTLAYDRDALVGEAILVKGLPGSLTDVAFSMKLLDGRSFSNVLRATRAGFLIPGPPDRFALAGEAIVGGMRRPLASTAVWLLLLAAALCGVDRRTMLGAAAVAALGHCAGQGLARQDVLGGSVLVANGFALALALVPAASLAGARVRAEPWLRSLTATAAILGLLHGAARPETVRSDGLSDPEQLLTVFGFGIGFGLAWALITLIGGELRALLRRTDRPPIWCGTLLGAVTLGFLIAELTGAWLARSEPVSGFHWMVALGALVGAGSREWGRFAPAGLAALLAAGAAIGLVGQAVPLGTTFVLGPIALLAAIIAVARATPGVRSLAVAGVAVLATAWFVAFSAFEISARPWTLVGAAWLAAFAAVVIGRAAMTDPVPWSVRGFATMVALLSVGMRIAGYRQWYDREFATGVALGWLRVPLLALGMLAVAVVVWPRRRRVVEALGLLRAKSSAHWIALGLALFLVPYGTIRVADPFFEPDAPRGAIARRVMTSVLSDTYHAFNLSEERELYDRLDDSVTSDLIDDIYLDSRRRLTAGTRAGAQVAVRDVRVVDISEPRSSGSGNMEFSYECSWKVVARVSHQLHVHHRQNVYRGILTLRVDGDRWKISGLELLSEDRSVVS